jgi:hypothetical protein
MSEAKKVGWRWCTIASVVLLAGPGWGASPQPPAKVHKVQARAQPRPPVATHTAPSVGVRGVNRAMIARAAALPPGAAWRPRAAPVSNARVSGLGGAAAYDARKGAVISGSIMHHRH